MISALKTIAEMIADSRRAQVHDVELVERARAAGARRRRDVGGGEDRRQDREVLGDVVGDRERGQRAAGDQQLLADLDDLDQLRRVRVEVDHVARPRARPGCRCSSPRRHRPAPAPARRWCRRRSSRPAGLAPAARGSARACAPGSPGRGSRRRRTRSAIFAAVSGLSPVTITVRMPIARSWSKRWRIPSLTTSLR